MEEEVVTDFEKTIDGRKAHHHRHSHHRHHSGGKGNHNHNQSRASSSEAIEDPFIRTLPNEEPNTLKDTLLTGTNISLCFLPFISTNLTSLLLTVRFFRSYH